MREGAGLLGFATYVVIVQLGGTWFCLPGEALLTQVTGACTANAELVLAFQLPNAMEAYAVDMRRWHVAEGFHCVVANPEHSHRIELARLQSILAGRGVRMWSGGGS